MARLTGEVQLTGEDLEGMELVLEWSAQKCFMTVFCAVFDELTSSGWEPPTDHDLPLSKRLNVAFAIQHITETRYDDLATWSMAIDRYDDCLEHYCKDQEALMAWLTHRRALLKGYLVTVLLKHLGIDDDRRPRTIEHFKVPSSFNASKYRSEISKAVRDLGAKRSQSNDVFMVERMEKRFLNLVSGGQVAMDETYEIVCENSFKQSDCPPLQIFLRQITNSLPKIDITRLSAGGLSSSFTTAADSSFAAARPSSAAKDIASLPAKGDVRGAVENFNRNAARNDPLPSVTGNKRNSSSFAARHGADEDEEEEHKGRSHKQPVAKASKLTNPTGKGHKIRSIDDDEAEEDDIVGFADSDDDAPPRGKSNVEALALKRKQTAANKPLPSKLPSSSSSSAAGGGGKVAKAQSSTTVAKKKAADADTSTNSNNNGRRPRILWTMDEEAAIRQGAQDYGRWQDHRDKGSSERVYVMDWKRVLDENKDVFEPQRRSNDLKDKWKNMFAKDRSLARPDDGSSPEKASSAPKPKAKAKQQHKSGGRKSTTKKRVIESDSDDDEDDDDKEEEEEEEEEVDEED